MTAPRGHRPELKAGQTGMNRGVPYRLLYRVRIEDAGDIWHCEPLFVTGPTRDVLFYAGDRFRPLHGF
jgi:hypothetical protein